MDTTGKLRDAIYTASAETRRLTALEGRPSRERALEQAQKALETAHMWALAATHHPHCSCPTCLVALEEEREAHRLARELERMQARA